MYLRAHFHGRKLCPALTAVCLLVVFAGDHAQASQVQLDPAHFSGGITITTTGQSITATDFGVPYSLELDEPPHGASGGQLGGFATPLPYVTADVGALAQRTVNAIGTVTYDLAVVGPDGLVPVLVSSFGAITTEVGSDGTHIAIAQAAWMLQEKL